jgi:hypothetical protein
MANEIADLNRLEIWKEPGSKYWTARLGPPGLGITMAGYTPHSAVIAVAMAAMTLNWPFDEAWLPFDVRFSLYGRDDERDDDARIP